MVVVRILSDPIIQSILKLYQITERISYHMKDGLTFWTKIELVGCRVIIKTSLPRSSDSSGIGIASGDTMGMMMVKEIETQFHARTSIRTRRSGW